MVLGKEPGTAAERGCACGHQERTRSCWVLIDNPAWLHYLFLCIFILCSRGGFTISRYLARGRLRNVGRYIIVFLVMPIFSYLLLSPTSVFVFMGDVLHPSNALPSTLIHVHLPRGDFIKHRMSNDALPVASARCSTIDI